MTDPIVDVVCAKLQSRSAVGLKKYGTTLADNAATVKEKLVHIQEELMDGANYIEWLLQEKKMPTPMTIEERCERRTENGSGVQETGAANKALLTKTTENVTCENLSDTDERQAALDDFETGIRKALWSLGSYEKIDIDDFFYDDTIKTIRSALQSPRVPDAMFKKLGFLIKAVDGGTFENDPHDAIIDAAIRTLSSPRVPVIEILDTVLEQAEDEGLWFNAKYASEAYLQQELRRLHTVIERAYAELQKGN